MSKLLREGRLHCDREDITRFTSSISDDVRIARAVVRINLAHVIMLCENKIISGEDAGQLAKALRGVELKQNYDPSIEDIHMYIEEEVSKSVGPVVGGNLHVAKSRNDQVATALRMELRSSILNVVKALASLQEALLALARDNVETVMIGHTHTQPAQPITFGHILLSYFDAFERDLSRLREANQRVNRCPMGAGALAGTSFPVDRERVAGLLGFEGLVENSLDAVGSRDFICEAIWCLSSTAVNMGRMIEDLILWSSYYFDLLILPDDFASTSSIMPQKKNPDLLELMRAKMRGIAGGLSVAVNSIMSLPSTYNLDFQELTPTLWKNIDVLSECLTLLTRLIPRLRIREESALRKARESLSTSTELANVMVRKYKIPFRSAHTIVGAIAKFLVERELSPSSLDADLVNSIAKSKVGIDLVMSEQEVKASLDPRGFVASHNSRGGPAPDEVWRMLNQRMDSIESTTQWLRFREEWERNADAQLSSAVKSIVGAEGTLTT